MLPRYMQCIIHIYIYVYPLNIFAILLTIFFFYYYLFSSRAKTTQHDKLNKLIPSFRYLPIKPHYGLYSTTPSVTGFINQTMPIVAIFLRNKFIAWFSLIQSFHFLFTVSQEELNLSKSTNSNPNPLDQSPILKIVLNVIGLIGSYFNLIIPQEQFTNEAAAAVKKLKEGIDK